MIKLRKETTNNIVIYEYLEAVNNNRFLFELSSKDIKTPYYFSAVNNNMDNALFSEFIVNITTTNLDPFNGVISLSLGQYDYKVFKSFGTTIQELKDNKSEVINSGLAQVYNVNDKATNTIVKQYAKATKFYTHE